MEWSTGHLITIDFKRWQRFLSLWRKLRWERSWVGKKGSGEEKVLAKKKNRGRKWCHRHSQLFSSKALNLAKEICGGFSCDLAPAITALHKFQLADCAWQIQWSKKTWIWAFRECVNFAKKLVRVDHFTRYNVCIVELRQLSTFGRILHESYLQVT